MLWAMSWAVGFVISVWVHMPRKSEGPNFNTDGNLFSFLGLWVFAASMIWVIFTILLPSSWLKH